MRARAKKKVFLEKKLWEQGDPVGFLYKIASGAPKTGDPKHSFLAFPESVQKVVGSMSKIGQFFDHLNF